MITCHAFRPFYHYSLYRLRNKKKKKMADILPRIVLNKIFLCLSHGRTGLPDLHSCLLVNKNWSKEAVILLWSKPFYYTNHASLEKIIDVYLDCLDENDREELVEVYKFPLNIDFRKPYYPYASYHRHIYYRTLISLVDRWCGTHSPSGSKHPWFDVLMKKLVKLFENESRLMGRKLQRTLYLIETNQGVGFGPPRNIYFIQNETMKYISDIDRIWFGLYTETNAFLQELGKRCTNVVSISFIFFGHLIVHYLFSDFFFFLMILPLGKLWCFWIKN